NKVLHRDLKPANILLAKSGVVSSGLVSGGMTHETTHHAPRTTHQPKITDFGLAKLLDSDDDLTQTGAVIGTPPYMAPEQAEGRQADIGECTDIWALGVILYECLAGRPPFRGDSRTQTLEQVKRDPPPPLRHQRAEVPAELEAICLKCLEKEPS